MLLQQFGPTSDDKSSGKMYAAEGRRLFSCFISTLRTQHFHAITPQPSLLPGCRVVLLSNNETYSKKSVKGRCTLISSAEQKETAMQERAESSST